MLKKTSYLMSKDLSVEHFYYFQVDFRNKLPRILHKISHKASSRSRVRSQQITHIIFLNLIDCNIFKILVKK